FGIELPAMVNAAQPAFLVAPEEQRRAAVRAIGIDESDPAGAVAKRDQILAQKPHPDRRAVLFRQFTRQRGRLPIAAEQNTRGRAGPHPDEALAVFVPHPSPLRPGVTL